MTEECKPTGPAPQHERLLAHVGAWNVTCTYFMNPTGEPMEIECKETVEALGPFWTVSLFEATFFDQPFQGRATSGFEPHSGRYVGTWIDSMMPHLFYFTGEPGQDGEAIEMRGEGPSPVDGNLTVYRTVERSLSSDEREFEMFVTMPDGAEAPMAKYVYRRA